MSQDQLSIQAPAKINLFLRVSGRRSDGYHTLESRMQKLNLFDELLLTVRREPGIRLRCPGAELLENGENLVYKAAEYFFAECPLRRPDKAAGVEIVLAKRIPMAAGLGGGSSDAAACLQGLNRLFNSQLTEDQLAVLGLKLGADVPFFLLDSPAALAHGIGEILQSVAPLPHENVILVNPGFSLSTKWVYQTFALTEKENTGSLSNSQNMLYEEVLQKKQVLPADWAKAMVNDLERVSLAAYPQIGTIKEELCTAGALVSLMSGSGPTVFGLFAKQQQAKACFTVFAQRFSHVFLLAPLGKRKILPENHLGSCWGVVKR